MHYAFFHDEDMPVGDTTPNKSGASGSGQLALQDDPTMPDRVPSVLKSLGINKIILGGLGAVLWFYILIFELTGMSSGSLDQPCQPHCHHAEVGERSQ